MVDPYDDPKTTAAMCDAIDGDRSMTDVQQAVPVAGEVRVLEDEFYALSARADQTISEDDDTYAIGVRDGYETAVQTIDVLTGGDGEYRFCMGAGDHESHCPDPPTMIRRIMDRLTEPARKADRLGEPDAYRISWLEGGEPRMRVQLTTSLEPWLAVLNPTVTPLYAALPDPTHTREAEGVTVAEYNEAHDKIEEVVGGAFRDGFEEGWIFALTPDGSDYDERREEFGRAVDIEPSEAWEGYRDKYRAMLPVPALPALSAGSAQ